MSNEQPIDGVQLIPLSRFSDERGSFGEIFRLEWFSGFDRGERIQINHSESKPGVLRGLHYHQHQADYWYVPRGQIRVGLADLRLDSPTYLATQIVEMGEDKPLGLFIPAGVAHGFVALTEAMLLYVVDNYYDGSDEHGLAWNDPDLAIPWGIEAPELSERDAANPLLRELVANGSRS